MMVNASGCWDKAQDDHRAYFDKVVGRRLKASAKVLPAEVVDFLRSNHNLLRDGSSLDFIRVQRRFNSLLRRSDAFDKNTVIREIGKIFNYDAFSRKSQTTWDGYSLCAQSTIKTCPYCNLSFTHSVFVDDNGVARPPLDHYFDKSRYPLFSISLGNLVPSCSHCNTSFKGSKDFLKIKHMHPFEARETLGISLSVDPIRARWDISLLDRAQVVFTGVGSNTRRRNSLTTFSLLDRYKHHRDEAVVIAKGLCIYADTGFAGSPFEYVTRGVTAENYKDRIFGKMILDLVRYIGVVR